MKIMYFNIDNGKCIKPFTVLPAYRAYITGSKIHMIEACFNVGNISSNGYEWFQNQVKEDYEKWEQYPHLMKSLKKLALKESIKYLFKHFNHNITNHRFPYVLVWIDGMEYSDRHSETSHYQYLIRFRTINKAKWYDMFPKPVDIIHIEDDYHRVLSDWTKYCEGKIDKLITKSEREKYEREITDGLPDSVFVKYLDR